MDSIKGDWKYVKIGNDTYTDEWYLLEKGDNIPNYGEAKLNWLINYNSGKLIKLEDGNYEIKFSDGCGAVVDNTLALNINPSNLSNVENWGENVIFYCGDENINDKISSSEIIFDGVDDFLRLKNVEVKKNDGITFEFYGKYIESNRINILSKTYFDEDGNLRESSKGYVATFRNYLSEAGDLNLCLGNGEALSEYEGDSVDSFHWMYFMKVFQNELNGLENVYFSIVLDFNLESDSDKVGIKLYKNGEFLLETTCSKDYLEKGNIFDSDCDFTVGVMPLMGNKGESKGKFVYNYSKFSLYTCRLYCRNLDDTEISNNYDATINYFID